MKLLLTFLILNTLTMLNSQSVFPTYLDDPIWHLVQISDDTSYYTITATDSVLIDGEFWSIAVQFEEAGATVDTIGCYKVVGEQVIFKSENLEALRLYDFSLTQGEESYFPYFSYQNNPDTALHRVLFESSNEYEGTVRTQYLMRVSYLFEQMLVNDNVLWISGIGSTQHPFYNTLCLLENQCATSLLTCLEVGGQLIYQASGWNTCAPPQDIHRIYVDQNRVGGQQDGSSWSNAIQDLQDAIAIANAGDTIWVAQGIYFPTKNQDRTQSFILPDSVAFYGGFNGTENNLSTREVSTYETILSGDIGTVNDSSDNCYHVLKTSGFSRLDGFVIEGGIADWGNNEVSLNSGGGIFVDAEHHLHVSNCFFQKNYARNGGGIFVQTGGKLELINSIFQLNNAALSGAGLFYGPQNELDTISIQGCEFKNNQCQDTGPGVHIEAVKSLVEIEDCVFENNSCFLGGALTTFIEYDSKKIAIRNSSFSNNNGGALLLPYTSGISLSDSLFVEIDNTSFQENIIEGGDGGAAIHIIETLDGSAPIVFTINHSEFRLNQGFKSGAIYCFNGSKIEMNLNSCKFIENTSNLGVSGAIGIFPEIDAEFASINAINCLFQENTGAILLLHGGGKARSTLINCTFYKNGLYPIVKNDADENGILDNTMDIYNSIFYEPFRDMLYVFFNNDLDDPTLLGYHIEHCLLSDSECPPDNEFACGPNNIFAAEPLFQDEENGDFSLLPCSQGINQGSNFPLEGILLAQDIEGNIRVLDDTVDIGAYETSAFHLELDVEIVDATMEEPSGGSIQILAANGGIEPYSFQWSNGSINSSVFDLEAGSYEVTISDQTGCTKVFYFQVDLLTTTSSLEKSKFVSLYPNPVKSQLHIQYSAGPNDAALWAITNIYGQKIMEGNITKSVVLDMEDLPSGLYFFHLLRTREIWPFTKS